jgi:hypothetical protein
LLKDPKPLYVTSVSVHVQLFVRFTGRQELLRPCQYNQSRATLKLLPKPMLPFCVQYFPADATQQPLLATIFFGANDAALAEGCSGRQHVPVATYAATVREMALALKSRGVKHVVLMTPPPIEESMRIAANRVRRLEEAASGRLHGGDGGASGATQAVEVVDELDREDAVAREYGIACCEVRF